ncbi:MAG: methyltransferase domain-containing protein [Bryobacteraceae bacterium]
MAEFTGERVVPGLVEASLWDEHASRYSFAAALAAGKRVLDVGCGTGYGTAAMAETAACALGFDISTEAVDYATQHYGEKAKFIVGSAENFPAAIGPFGLITAFEVIEHLTDWPRLLSETSRVLADDGLFLVSTPNKTYYGEARQSEGPNPFHVHEFEYEELREALTAWFPQVRILAQNRVEAFSFFGEQSSASATATFAEAAHRVSDAHFYIAVCSRQPIPPLSYLYVPHDGNMLWERERHIHLLEKETETLREEREVATTQLAQFESDLEERSKWIAGLESERHVAAAQLAQFESDLEERSRWVANLEQEILTHQRERDAALAALKTAEHELEQRTNWANQIQRELTERTEWAQNLDQELTRARGQVHELIDKLSADEAVIAERTKWARELEREVNERNVEMKTIDEELQQVRMHLSDRESVIAELTREVTRGRRELGLLLAALRAQSAAANEHGRMTEVGQWPGLPHNEFAELRELVVELEKLRVSQARSFEIQMQSRSELQHRVEELAQERELVRKSRWLKLGRALGLGPRLE